jgi:GNAT superfamily N-acetyltransferase
MEPLAVTQLTDGREVLLRLAGPHDVAGIVTLFERLSPESFASRFMTASAGPAMVRRLASFDDPPGTICLVACSATSPDEVVAEARVLPTGGDAGELAVTVADSYQGVGLGHAVMDALVAQARVGGLSRLTAVVSLANTPMLYLLAPFGWVISEPTDGALVYLEVSAEGGVPGFPTDGPGRRVLVEGGSWLDDAGVSALRSAGDVVRRCLGPRRAMGHTCPLVTDGHCRLAEEADLIIDRLPEDDADCAAVLTAHRRRWPQRLEERSGARTTGASPDPG